MTRRQSTLRLVGVGVAVPSPIDPKHPDRVSELVLPDWRGHSGLEGLRVRFGAPLLVDNDANLGALAEHWWGAGRGVDDFAYIKLATGIGSGHVVGGEIYRGATGVAGEIGHLAIDPHGGPCLCGLRGCLVTLVGAQAMVARARELLADQPDSALGRRDLDITAIEEAALGGDALALVLVREAAEYLGIALAGMLNLMNPARVILGGGLSRLGELLLEPVRETVRTRTLVSSLDASEIRTSELGPQAVALGASTLVLKTALDDSSLFPPPAARNGVR
jgi:predicted NBD/HSP70 family sugar kinase